MPSILSPISILVKNTGLDNSNENSTFFVVFSSVYAFIVLVFSVFLSCF